MKPRRVLLYGGTFDPPHRSHRRLVETALGHLDLDALVVVPCRDHPFKGSDTTSSGEARLALCERAFGDLPGVEISRVELDREGPSYTIDTLRHLREREGDSAWLGLLIGSDNLADFDRWHEAAALRASVELVVYPRLDDAGAVPARPDPLPGGVTWLEFEADAVSATAIRAALRRGDESKALELGLMHEVLETARTHSLYREDTC